MLQTGVLTFFLRVVGKESSQIHENRRFKANLKRCAEQESKLDVILESIDRINNTAKKKKEALEGCCSNPPSTKGVT